MPLFIPFVIGGVALALGAAGVKQGVDGVSDLRRAEAIGLAAQRRHGRTVRVVESTRDRVNQRACRYGKLKLDARQETFARLIRLLEKLERRGGLERARFLRELDVTRDEVEAFRAESVEAQQIVAGFLRAGLGGATAASAAYGLAGSIGVASTGAAISGLSGAAATSASLAWLGGGALAAGGFGMAGGMVVLGGVVAGPALALGGFMIANRGERALTEASAYVARVDRAIADLETLTSFLTQVDRRIKEMHSLVSGLRTRLDALLTSIEERSNRWNVKSASDREKLREAMQLAGALSEIIRTPVLNAKGKLTMESASLVARYGELPS